MVRLNVLEHAGWHISETIVRSEEEGYEGEWDDDADGMRMRIMCTPGGQCRRVAVRGAGSAEFVREMGDEEEERFPLGGGTSVCSFRTTQVELFTNMRYVYLHISVYSQSMFSVKVSLN